MASCHLLQTGSCLGGATPSQPANNNRKIGVEEESIIYTSDNKRIPVNSSNPISATNLLKNLNEKIDGNGYYSLEPGGQIEWSSLPYSNLIKLDQAQKLKNAHTKTRRCLISTKSQYKVALTGTPIENRIQDIWSLFDINGDSLH